MHLLIFVTAIVINGNRSGAGMHRYSFITKYLTICMSIVILILNGGNIRWLKYIVRLRTAALAFLRIL